MSQTNKMDYQNYQRNYQKKFRDIVFNFYGSKCNCCGEDGRSFLAIDHINNDGHSDRAEKGYKRRGYVLYKYIVKQNFPDTYQILCWNCNWSKRVNKGICEHKIINQK